MRAIDSTEPDWQSRISKLVCVIDLDETAHAPEALVRRRCVGDAPTLLQLALAYGPGVRLQTRTIVDRFAEIVRHVCDQPRRRKSQAAGARI